MLKPLERALVPTGLAIALPPGYEAEVRPRSGLAAEFGITVLNAPGTIDADYRGEIKVILINLGDAPFEVKDGDRIAQMVFKETVRVRWQEVERLPESATGGRGLRFHGKAMNPYLALDAFMVHLKTEQGASVHTIEAYNRDILHYLDISRRVEKLPLNRSPWKPISIACGPRGNRPAASPGRSPP